MSYARGEIRAELSELINRLSLENASDTPDFILAEFWLEVLDAWNKAVQRREQHYDRKMEPFR